LIHGCGGVFLVERDSVDLTRGWREYFFQGEKGVGQVRLAWSVFRFECEELLYARALRFVMELFEKA
jgi:hypothetical protein